jgi:hypothetical protein
MMGVRERERERERKWYIFIFLTLKVSNCVFGCDIQELKKLKSPSKPAFPFASAYAGSNPTIKGEGETIR